MSALMTELLRRLHYLLTRRRHERELEDELTFHREMAGVDPTRRLGDTVRLREAARDAWGWVWLDRLWQDVRFAGRTLRRSPGFAVAAVLMLGVGIGVNVAAFGLFNLIALRPLPVRNPDTLLRFERRSPEAHASDLSYPHMAFLAEHARALSAVLAAHQTRLSLERGEAPVRVHFVTSNYFSELGAGTILGRLIAPGGRYDLAADPVVVLSHAFWTRRFAASPTIVGTTLRLNGKTATVIGVAEAKFSGMTMGTPEIWAPLGQQPYFVEGSRLLEDISGQWAGVKMWGRLAPGVGREAVEHELSALTATLRKAHPDAIWDGETLPSSPAGYAQMGGGSSRGTGAAPPDDAMPIMALGGTLILLILCVACANLGGLLLARGIARDRELTIRVAVGAGAGRLVRQLFTESLLLGLLGALAGVAVSYALLRATMAMGETASWIDVRPDRRVLACAMALGVLSSVLFGLAPALQVGRRRHRSQRLRHALVAVQIAASAVLLIVSGLLLRAVAHVTSTSPGFSYEQVIAVSPKLNDYGFSPGAAQAYLEALAGRLQSLPVASVSLATVPPLGNVTSVARIARHGTVIHAHLNRVDPEYFKTMRIPLLRGRRFTESDSHGVVVSESLALRYWPGEDPIGQQYDDHTVIGVVGSARTVALQDADATEAYYLRRPEDLPAAVVLIRSRADAESIAAAVAGVAASVDPKVYADVRLLKSAFHDRMQKAQLSAIAVGGLGACALALACLGIVGLVAYTVSQRTREIGIRLALGASAGHVLAIVVRQLRRPVVWGLVAGMLLAAALSQLMRRELYGVSSVDPIAYLSATGLFIAAVAVAALLPARRALRVDPIRALRTE